MQRASVTRLYRDRSSQAAIMLLEGTDTKERFKVTLPVSRAGILALEGHGLNDRCALYGMLCECISVLGAEFGSVIVTLDEANGVKGALSVSKDEKILSWVSADVVELVALALHVQLPIYIHVENCSSSENSLVDSSGASLPIVFEEALSEILKSGETHGQEGVGEIRTDLRE